MNQTRAKTVQIDQKEAPNVQILSKLPKMYLKTPKIRPKSDETTSLLLYVQQPNHSALRDEIEAHKYVYLREYALRREQENAALYPHRKSWYTVMFALSDCVIVQCMMVRAGDTRFALHKVTYEDWKTVFVEWIDEGHDHFDVVDSTWTAGMRDYGADI
jgi:hypothetical protein